jgi:Domain of unknown function (DUF4388)
VLKCENGFEGTLSGASIEDIIQIACLTLATRAVHIDAGGRQGHLYLGGGQLVHAEAADMRGEEALFEILAWREGRFHIEEGCLPPRETITRLWQSLLLEAAHRSDEDQRARNSSGSQRMNDMELSKSDPFDVPEIRDWVRFTIQGQRIAGRSMDTEELQACGAYMIELSEALGQALGLEAFRSIEVRGPEGRFVCQTQSGLAVVATAGAGVDLMSLAEGRGAL